ncbi:hypothetical protein R3P38DRAFT_3206625 [Favolaschia claudopus]|uniref:Uncharacterized protein n=1 Tax=Favolaschia claudopus TaxID=2862362 RepID=A0AAW0APQ3_9AGAR
MSRLSAFAALAFAASAVALSNLQVPSSATPDKNVTITWTSDSSDPSPLTLALFSADSNKTFAGGLAIANDVNVGQNQITILFPQLVSPGVRPSIHPSHPVPIHPSIHPSFFARMHVHAPPPSPPSQPSPSFPPPLRLMIPMLPSSYITLSRHSSLSSSMSLYIYLSIYPSISIPSISIVSAYPFPSRNFPSSNQPTN